MKNEGTKSKATLSKKQLLTLLIALALLTAGVVSTAHFFYKTIGAEEIKVDVIVGDHYGFSVDTDTLDMGMVTPGGSTNTRDLVLTNNHDFPVRVRFVKKGDMKDWLRIANQAVIPPEDTTTIKVSAHVPPETPYGQYNGTLLAIFIRE